MCEAINREMVYLRFDSLFDFLGERLWGGLSGWSEGAAFVPLHKEITTGAELKFRGMANTVFFWVRWMCRPDSYLGGVDEWCKPGLHGENNMLALYLVASYK